MPWIIDEAVVIETESTESVFPISDTSEVLASFLLDMLASFLFNLKQKQLIHRGLRALDLRYFKKDFLNKKWTKILMLQNRKSWQKLWWTYCKTFWSASSFLALVSCSSLRSSSASLSNSKTCLAEWPSSIEGLETDTWSSGLKKKS